MISDDGQSVYDTIGCINLSKFEMYVTYINGT